MASRFQLLNPDKFISRVGSFGDSAWYRWGFLLLFSALLVLNIATMREYPSNDSDLGYTGLFIAIMLLLNHLESFVRSARMKWSFRIIAWSWMIFTFAYMFNRGLHLGKH